MAILLLALSLLFFSPEAGNAQTQNGCIPLDCGPANFFVQVIPDPGNTQTTACQTTTPFGNAVLFWAAAHPPLASGIPPYSGLPVCVSQFISGEIKTENDNGLQNVNVQLGPDFSPSQPPSCTQGICEDMMLTGPSGGFGMCPCEDCDYFEVIPYKNDNHTNGITTFDLVLINKHILGIQPFGSPYKRIAADANKSNSITTFDVVELRKLILGIYNDLPMNTSWRFVDKDYVFQDPENPFVPAFPESIKGLNSTNNTANFVALKVGDVNNSVMPSSKPSPALKAAISWPAPSFSRSIVQTITIPVRYTGPDTLMCYQMALRFNGEKLKLLGVTPGDLAGFNRNNYYASASDPGSFRVLWWPANLSEPSQVITSETVLFYLTFKVLSSFESNNIPMQIDVSNMPALAWKANGAEYTLEYEPRVEERAETREMVSGLTAFCRPNSGSEAPTLVVDSPDARKARIALFDINGVRSLVMDISLSEGEQAFTINGADLLPSGVYVWKVISPGAKVQGHWVKL